MPYQVHATVNYPEAKEVDTPNYIVSGKMDLLQWVHIMLNQEPDATSFVITVVKS